MYAQSLTMIALGMKAVKSQSHLYYVTKPKRVYVSSTSSGIFIVLALSASGDAKSSYMSLGYAAREAIA